MGATEVKPESRIVGTQKGSSLETGLDVQQVKSRLKQSAKTLEGRIEKLEKAKDVRQETLQLEVSV